GGYAMVKWRDYGYFNYIPPLMPALAALALLSKDIRLSDGTRPVIDANSGYIDAGNRLIALSGEDIWRVTMLARLPTLILGGALIAVMFIFLRTLLGPLPALGATTLAAFSPNLLAHAKLATSDVGCAFFMFCAVAAFWWARHGGGWNRWLLCGVLTGLALVSKFTGLLLGPIFVILVVVETVTKCNLPRHEAGGVEARPLFRQFLELVFAASIAWLVVGATYHGTFDYSLYLEGIHRIYADHLGGYEFFLFGKYSADPFWYYYFGTLLVKMPVGSLILVAFGLFLTATRGPMRVAMLYMYVPAGVILFVSCFDSSNVGLRRIIPAVPFLLALSAPCFLLIRRNLSMGMGALALMTVMETASAFPHHLSFFNAPSLTIRHPTELADDSNLDWDLDIPRLAQWQRDNAPDEPINTFLRWGERWMGSYGVYGVPVSTLDLVQPNPVIYAISAHNLVRMRRFEQTHHLPLDWLSRYEPVAQAGPSIYIYDFRKR
ncbi:MAG: hypothetical protein ACI8PT_002021, partial [Gammaproteobacteria bacterium]